MNCICGYHNKFNETKKCEYCGETNDGKKPIIDFMKDHGYEVLNGSENEKFFKFSYKKGEGQLLPRAIINYVLHEYGYIISLVESDSFYMREIKSFDIMYEEDLDNVALNENM